MKPLFRWRAPVPALVLALAVASVAACSSHGSTSTPTATPTTAASGGPPSGATGTAAGTASTCHGTTAATGGVGGGDVLVPGDIPDNQAYVTYQSPDGYHLAVPEGWARTQSAGATAFSDKFNAIRVQVTTAAAAPSVASAQATDVAALATTTPCFTAGKVTSVSRKAGSAILITYRADSPPDAVTGKVIQQDVERYEFWQAGKLVTLTLSAPKGSDNVDPWRKVTDSFAWGP